MARVLAFKLHIYANSNVHGRSNCRLFQINHSVGDSEFGNHFYSAVVGTVLIGIFKRLGGHLSGQSGNMGISNYAKTQKVKFTYYTAEVLSNYGQREPV